MGNKSCFSRGTFQLIYASNRYKTYLLVQQPVKLEITRGTCGSFRFYMFFKKALLDELSKWEFFSFRKFCVNQRISCQISVKSFTFWALLNFPWENLKTISQAKEFLKRPLPLNVIEEPLNVEKQHTSRGW